MKEEITMNKDHAVGFGIGLLTGAAIGAIIALLLHRKVGKRPEK